MIRLSVMHDRPFGILVQESAYGWQKARASVFTPFTKDLRIVEDDPATDLIGVPLEFVRQLVSRVASINEQQIAGLNVNRQRIALYEREFCGSLL